MQAHNVFKIALSAFRSSPNFTGASLWSVAFDTLCGFSDISSFKSIISVICPDCSSVRSGFSFPAFCVFALSLFCDFSERSGSDIRSDFSAFADFLDRFALPVFSDGSAFPDSSASSAFPVTSGFPDSSANPAFSAGSAFPDSSASPAFSAGSAFPDSSAFPAFPDASGFPDSPALPPAFDGSDFLNDRGFFDCSLPRSASASGPISRTCSASASGPFSRTCSASASGPVFRTCSASGPTALVFSCSGSTAAPDPFATRCFFSVSILWHSFPLKRLTGIFRVDQ